MKSVTVRALGALLVVLAAAGCAQAPSEPGKDTDPYAQGLATSSKDYIEDRQRLVIPEFQPANFTNFSVAVVDPDSHGRELRFQQADYLALICINKEDFDTACQQSTYETLRVFDWGDRVVTIAKYLGEGEESNIVDGLSSKTKSEIDTYWEEVDFSRGVVPDWVQELSEYEVR